MDHPEPVWRERALREAVLAGDADAWKAFYDENFGPLFAYVHCRTGRRLEDTEEIVQETWLVAVKKIARFDPGRGGFEGWLRGIADNVVLSALSQSEAQIRYLLGLGGDLRLEPPKPDAAAAPAVPKPAKQRPPIPDKFKKFLQMQVHLQFSEPRPLQDVLETLRKMGDDTINFAYDRGIDWDELNVKLDANGISTESFMLMIHDLCDEIVFVFRDYGILVTHSSNRHPECATIPVDLPTDGE